MKSYQRVAIFKAGDLLTSVPLPHLGHGTKTASVEGAMRYAHDMDRARTMYRRIREAVACGDPASEVNDLLGEFVEWHQQRTREDWR